MTALLKKNNSLNDTYPKKDSLQKRISRLATLCLYEELALEPKPGLVSFSDPGSHKDMDAHTFLKSIISLQGYFKEITDAGMREASFYQLKTLGCLAEERMLQATGGINTHRGGIFCLGLLCAAAGACFNKHGLMNAGLIRQELLHNWGESLKEHACSKDNMNTPILGARLEASLGMPCLFLKGVPYLKRALAAKMPLQQALIETFMNLMGSLHDTNLIRRGGPDGLTFAQNESKKFIREGGTLAIDWQKKLWCLHQKFIDRNLSPGGSADILAASLFIHLLEQL